jgi:hypothetical protein
MLSTTNWLSGATRERSLRPTDPEIRIGAADTREGIPLCSQVIRHEPTFQFSGVALRRLGRPTATPLRQFSPGRLSGGKKAATGVTDRARFGLFSHLSGVDRNFWTRVLAVEQPPFEPDTVA